MDQRFEYIVQMLYEGKWHTDTNFLADKTGACTRYASCLINFPKHQFRVVERKIEDEVICVERSPNETGI